MGRLNSPILGMPPLNACVKLSRHDVIHPDDDMGIEVVSGCVWLTHEGCAVDWILQSGDRALLQAARGSLACAMSDAEVWIRRAGSRKRLAGLPFALRR